MSSSKATGSGGLAGKVLILEGTSNYHPWLESIQSFLMMLKVWRIADGTSLYPTTGNNEVKNTWFDLDYQALGVISLHIKEDLHTSVAKIYGTTFASLSHTTLANLAKLYATFGLTSQFYQFREIVNWRLGGGDVSAEVAHLVDLFARLEGAGLDLPNNLHAMIICTGLGDNYSNLVTTAVHTIGMTDFTPDKIIPMILAELQQQGTSLANCISSNKAKTIKKASSECCKICHGTSHKTENCWKLTRKPGSAGNSGNQNKINQQKTQQNTGNQSSGGDNKKKGKGKGKANETHVADEAMILDEPDIGDNDSDVTIKMDGLPSISSFFLGKPGELSTARIDDEEILDWGESDDGMESSFMAQPNTSFCRMSF